LEPLAYSPLSRVQPPKDGASRLEDGLVVRIQVQTVADNRQYLYGFGLIAGSR
jgi:hypothetical protein